MRVMQTILVSKAAASTRRKAEGIARAHADRIYTSRETPNYWRFRQRPTSCFRGGFQSAKIRDGKVILVYGTLREGAKNQKACR